MIVKDDFLGGKSAQGVNKNPISWTVQQTLLSGKGLA